MTTFACASSSDDSSARLRGARAARASSTQAALKHELTAGSDTVVMRSTDLKPSRKPANVLPCVERDCDVPPYLRRYADERDAWQATRQSPTSNR